MHIQIKLATCERLRMKKHGGGEIVAAIVRRGPRRVSFR
jgi:hypothetical protein